MTAVEQWACKPWCQAANPYVAVACDCGMADVRALVAERDQLRELIDQAIDASAVNDGDELRRIRAEAGLT